jgi:hypothetical protein
MPIPDPGAGNAVGSLTEFVQSPALDRPLQPKDDPFGRLARIASEEAKEKRRLARVAALRGKTL